MKHEPTEKQRYVLQSSDNLVVVGTPGTGKTTLALWKAQRFITENNLLRHERVLFMSFSNAAVARIHEAAKLRLPRKVRRHLTVTTFHSLCFGLLRSHSRLLGLSGTFQLFPPEDVTILRNQGGTDVERELGRLEREESRICFDRFAPLTRQILEGHEPIRLAYSRSFPLVIVDEYQDTSDDEDQVMRLLTRDGQLICLGDPEQRIYDFRPGTHAGRLAQLQADPQFESVQLENTNHRSGGADIVPCARAVLEGTGAIPKPERVVAWSYRTHKSLADSLKKAIVSLERAVRRQKGQPDARVTVAIMGMTNAFVGQLSRLLKTPSKTFERPFSHQVLVSYEDLCVAWDTALIVLEGSYDARTCAVQTLRSAARLDLLRGSATAKEHASTLQRWSEALESEGGRAPASVKRLVAAIEEMDGAWTGDPVEDLASVREMLRRIPGKHFARTVTLLDLRLPAGPGESATPLLTELFRERRNYSGCRRIVSDVVLRERLTETQGGRARRLLMTLHKCKGKEFDGVIIVDGLGPPNRLLLRHESVESCPASRKLLSVALTRARYAAVVFSPAWDRCALLPAFRAKGT